MKQTGTIIDSAAPVRTTWGVMILISGAIATGATAFAVLKAEEQATRSTLIDHDARIRAIERKVEADHDLLLEIRGDVKALRKTP